MLSISALVILLLRPTRSLTISIIGFMVFFRFAFARRSIAHVTFFFFAEPAILTVAAAIDWIVAAGRATAGAAFGRTIRGLAAERLGPSTASHDHLGLLCLVGHHHPRLEVAIPASAKRLELFFDGVGVPGDCYEAFCVHFVCLSLTSGNRPGGCNSLLRDNLTTGV